MNILLVGTDDLRCKSLGMQALCDGMMWKLRKVFPGSTVSQLYLRPFFRGVHRFIRWARWFWLRALLWKFAEFYYSRQHIARCKKLQWAHLVLINGDGVISDDFPAETFMLSLECRRASRLGKICASMNQSVNISSGSFSHFCLEQELLQHPVSVREPDTLKALREINYMGEPVLSIDAAFLVKPLSEREQLYYDELIDELRMRHQFEDFLLVGVRGVRPSRQNISINAWSAAVKIVMSTYPGTRCVLASTCMVDDIDLARKIAQRVPGSIVLEELLDSGRYNYRFFLQFLRRSLCSISDRYHQNVLAALAGTPFVAVEGNTSKTIGITSLLEYPIPILPLPTPENLKVFESTIRDFAERRKEISEYLTRVVPGKIEEHDRDEEFLEPLGRSIQDHPSGGGIRIC